MENFIRNDDVLPSLLYKNFTSSEDAANFKSGNILIRRIEYHQKWEKDNQRLDITENQASYYYINNNMTINGSLTYVNPVYILSTSGPLSNRGNCENKFGHYEVKIINPELFKINLQKAWKDNPLTSSFNIFKVEYSKGEKREIPPYMIEPHGLSLYQKSKDHVDDDEYRFIFSCRMNPAIEHPDSLTLNIDHNAINLVFE